MKTRTDTISITIDTEIQGQDFTRTSQQVRVMNIMVMKTVLIKIGLYKNTSPLKERIRIKVRIKELGLIIRTKEPDLKRK